MGVGRQPREGRRGVRHDADGAEPAEHLDDRRERQATLAEGQAASPKDDRVGGTVRELGEQAGLADAGVTAQQHQPRMA